MNGTMCIFRPNEPCPDPSSQSVCAGNNCLHRSIIDLLPIYNEEASEARKADSVQGKSDRALRKWSASQNKE